jgi:hypothetical protein
MLITLTPGLTTSVWISLREDLPYGSTASFLFTLTNDVSGATKSFYPTDLQPDNKWSEFEIGVGTPENLNISKLNLVAGMWSYVVTAGQKQLETGKVVVTEQKNWSALDRPAKTSGAIRR